MSRRPSGGPGPARRRAVRPPGRGRARLALRLPAPLQQYPEELVVLPLSAAGAAAGFGWSLAALAQGIWSLPMAPWLLALLPLAAVAAVYLTLVVAELGLGPGQRVKELAFWLALSSVLVALPVAMGRGGGADVPAILLFLRDGAAAWLGIVATWLAALALAWPCLLVQPAPLLQPGAGEAVPAEGEGQGARRAWPAPLSPAQVRESVQVRSLGLLATLVALGAVAGLIYPHQPAAAGSGGWALALAMALTVGGLAVLAGTVEAVLARRQWAGQARVDPGVGPRWLALVYRLAAACAGLAALLPVNLSPLARVDYWDVFSLLTQRIGFVFAPHAVGRRPVAPRTPALAGLDQWLGHMLQAFEGVARLAMVLLQLAVVGAGLWAVRRMLRWLREGERPGLYRGDKSGGWRALLQWLWELVSQWTGGLAERWRATAGRSGAGPGLARRLVALWPRLEVGEAPAPPTWEAQVRQLFAALLHAAARRGWTRSAHQTAAEYAARLATGAYSPDRAPEAGGALWRLLALYQDVRYGGRRVTPEVVAEAEGWQRAALAGLRRAEDANTPDPQPGVSSPLAPPAER